MKVPAHTQLPPGIAACILSDETSQPAYTGSEPLPKSPRVRSNDEYEVPLHLVSFVIARQIRRTGDKIYRISVKRIHGHYYNVPVRIKPIARELAPKHVVVFSQVPGISSGNHGAAIGADGGDAA